MMKEFWKKDVEKWLFCQKEQKTKKKSCFWIYAPLFFLHYYSKKAENPKCFPTFVLAPL